jgi:hypothetical protein
MLDKAASLNPDSGLWYAYEVALAQIAMGQTEEASRTAREVINRHPDSHLAYRGLSA